MPHPQGHPMPEGCQVQHVGRSPLCGERPGQAGYAGLWNSSGAGRMVTAFTPQCVIGNDAGVSVAWLPGPLIPAGTVCTGSGKQSPAVAVARQRGWGLEKQTFGTGAQAWDPAPPSRGCRVPGKATHTGAHGLGPPHHESGRHSRGLTSPPWSPGSRSRSSPLLSHPSAAKWGECSETGGASIPPHNPRALPCPSLPLPKAGRASPRTGLEEPGASCGAIPLLPTLEAAGG